MITSISVDKTLYIIQQALLGYRWEPDLPHTVPKKAEAGLELRI